MADKPEPSEDTKNEAEVEAPKAVSKSATKTEAPKRRRRATLVNADRRNGRVGDIARPYEDVASEWLGKGWVRKSAGTAD